MGTELLFESIEPADPPEDDEEIVVEDDPRDQLVGQIEILTAAVRELTEVMRRMDGVTVLPRKS